jgi:hypothetical protein
MPRKIGLIRKLGTPLLLGISGTAWLIAQNVPGKTVASQTFEDVLRANPVWFGLGLVGLGIGIATTAFGLYGWVLGGIIKDREEQRKTIGAVLDKLRQEKDELTEKIAADEAREEELNAKIAELHKFTEVSLSFRGTISLPIRVVFFGPISGPKRSWGLSHIRGAMIGVLRTLQELSDIEDLGYGCKLLKLGFVDTANLTSEQVCTKYQEALSQNPAIIFGPMASEEASYLFVERGLAVTSPTILAAAGTPKVKRSEHFGTNLLQLVANTDVHAKHLDRLVRYFPDRSQLVVLARDDEYGKCCCESVCTHVTLGTDPVIKCYSTELIQNDPDEAARIAASVASNVSQRSKTGADVILHIAETGDALRKLIRELRSQLDRVKFVTFTSMDQSALSGGHFDGMLLICSYYSKVFSINMLEFRRQRQAAEFYLNQEPDLKMESDSWQSLSSVDAEAHDAAVHAITNLIVPNVQELRKDKTGNLFVTNFRMQGIGKRLENAASLHALQVSGDKLVPTEVTLGN